MATTSEIILGLISSDAPGSPVAMYMTGSSCDGGLRPESDLDILLITRAPLQAAERRLLIDHLLGYSGRRATRQPGRPIELTSLARDDIKPWRYPATRDFLYGEWERTKYEAGFVPSRAADPNLPVLLTSARKHSSVLMGPPLAELTDPVPLEHLRQSMFDVVPGLLDSLAGDERNVLLTLARVLYTLRTGLIAPKDVAAAVIRETLGTVHGGILDLAAQAYRGEACDDWTTIRAEASATASALAERIYSLRPSGRGGGGHEEQCPGPP